MALNRVFLLIACAIVLVTATAAWHGSPAPAGGGGAAISAAFPMGIASGVLVVAYYGLAMQYFLLRFGARGVMYFALFLFLAWVLPLVGGTIMMMASGYRTTRWPAEFIFSVSPIAGLGLSAGASQDESFLKAMQGASITPALLFTFVFNSLLIAARRMHHKAFQNAATEAQKSNTPAERQLAVALEGPLR